MTKKLITPAKYLGLLALAGFLLAVLVPRSYEVAPLQKRAGTQYWELRTGSKIAFTLLAAKGAKQPYPVIYLHGGPGGFITELHLQMLAPLAEAGYEVYLYDQIGSGQSARLDNINAYTPERHQRDLEAIVEEIGAAKVILLGQSWGAVLATLFVAEQAAKVHQLILTGPGAIQPQQAQWQQLAAPDSLALRQPVYSNREANAQSQNIRTRAMAFCASYFGKKLASDQEADAYQTYLNGQLNKATVCDTSKALKATGGGGYYAQLMTVQAFGDTQDPRPKLRGATLPVLIMKGQCDNQAWGAVAEYMQLFANHQLKIIPDAGHAIAVEQPVLYSATMLAFLRQEPAEAPNVRGK